MPTPGKHIVDALIEERAPTLSRSMAWPLLRPPLYAILNYAKARRMADTIAPLPGQAALDHIRDLLKLRVETRRLERLPQSGSFVLIANHPTGIADGIAVYDAVRPLRPDVAFYANSDANRVCARFGEILIPVEWVPEKRTRERTRLTLKMTAEAVERGRPIMIFPAGRLARKRAGHGVIDPEWQASAVSIARKYDLTVVPCHVAGPYAWWFHFFDSFSKELRDITLFHELLNKQGGRYALTLGPPIAPEALAGDAASVTRRLKRYVERVLPADPDAPFNPAGEECPWRDPPRPVSRPTAPVPAE